MSNRFDDGLQIRSTDGMRSIGTLSSEREGRRIKISSRRRSWVSLSPQLTAFDDDQLVIVALIERVRFVTTLTRLTLFDNHVGRI